MCDVTLSLAHIFRHRHRLQKDGERQFTSRAVLEYLGLHFGWLFYIGIPRLFFRLRLFCLLFCFYLCCVQSDLSSLLRRGFFFFGFRFKSLHSIGITATPGGSGLPHV